MRAGQLDMPRQDTWDPDEHAFRKSFGLQAEPVGPAESGNTRSSPRPAPLAEYEATVTNLISSRGGCQADRRLLASATGNFPSGNLFDLPRYRFWTQ